jgi:hypothetical protein
MTNQILFIHGAGAGAYKEDQPLVDSLKHALGDEYRVAYPQVLTQEVPTICRGKPNLAKSWWMSN